MDLPTCPSCQQSVLDDDAQECPFCGAPMKGGAAGGDCSAPPQGAPAAKAPAKDAAPKSAGKSAPPAVNPAAPQRAAKEPAKPEDDDPFAVDTSEGAKAIPVSPTSGGGRTLEVKCPMCETAGYVTPKASGQMIKCCNPKCLVPLFQAPVIEKPAPPPAAPQKKQIPVALYASIGVVAVVAIAGLGYVFFGGSQTPTQPPVVPVDGTASGGTGTSTTTGDPEQGTGGDQKKDTKVDEAAKTAAARKALIDRSLKSAVNAAQSADPRRKPYGRRLAAVAYAAAGDIENASEQVQQLQKIGKTAPHEAILPLVAIGWLQLPASEANFRKSIDEALALAGELPNRGRYAVEASISLAAALCTAGKTEDARKVLADHRGTAQQDQLAAVLQVCESRRTFDAGAPLPARTFGEWQFPVETAVTLVLVAHGREEDASAWIKAIDPAARGESTVALAESLAARGLAKGDEAALDNAAALAKDQPPAVKAWLLARIADVCLSHKQPQKAGDYLKQAEEGAKASTPPEAVRLEGVRAIMEYKSPDIQTLRQAAIAQGEIAGLHARLKQQQPSRAALERALEFLRGSAPTVSVMKVRMDQIAGNQNAPREELKTEFDLKTNDAVLRQYAKYKQVCAGLASDAQARYRWEVALLEAAVRWGLLDFVRDEIVQYDGAADLNNNQPFLTTGLPVLLAQQYAAAGNKEQQAAVLAAARPRMAAADRVSVVAAQAAGFDAGDLKGMLKLLNETMADTGILHEATLQLACRMVHAGKVKEALLLVTGLKDIILREDGLRLISSLAARLGQGEALEKQATAFRLSHSEDGNVTAGLVMGLTAGGK
jgi:hypothetical protein